MRCAAASAWRPRTPTAPCPSRSLPRPPDGGQLASAIDDLLTAAEMIEDAAASAGAASQPGARRLADDPRSQAEAIAYWIASAARATSRIPSAGS
jgi:hypothetical protein